MNKTTLQSLLELPDSTPIILHQLHVIAWGRTLIFDGTAGDVPFTLMLDECREMRWRVYAHLDESSLDTALVDFAPGRDQHRSPLNMLTTRFGLSVYYGVLRVERR